MSDTEFVREITTIQLCKHCKGFNDECNKLIENVINLENQLETKEKNFQLLAAKARAYEDALLIYGDSEHEYHVKSYDEKTKRYIMKTIIEKTKLAKETLSVWGSKYSNRSEQSE